MAIERALVSGSMAMLVMKLCLKRICMDMR